MVRGGSVALPFLLLLLVVVVFGAQESHASFEEALTLGDPGEAADLRVTEEDESVLAKNSGATTAPSSSSSSPSSPQPHSSVDSEQAGLLKDKNNIRNQLMQADATLSIQNPKKSMYERELERLNRKITKTTTSAKVTFANLLNAFKARSAKTKADGEARRKMILEEHNKRWLRTSTLLNQQKEKELAEHKADHEKRVKSFEERAARHVEKLREAVKLFLEKVEKRKKEMQESFELKQKAIKTDHEQRLLTEKNHATEVQSRALSQHAERVRQALENAKQIYLSAKAKAEAWLKEKMEFLESMKKRALENLSKNKETLEERAKKIQSELVSANELSTQNSEAAENEASKNSESESTTSGGLIQNEAKKLLEKSEKELVDKYKRKLAESHITAAGSQKSLKELPNWFKQKDEDLKKAYEAAVKDATKLVGDEKPSNVLEEEEEEEEEEVLDFAEEDDEEEEEDVELYEMW